MNDVTVELNHFPRKPMREGYDFDEEFVQVKDGKIIIPWYYFPTTQTKVIDIKDVKGVKYGNQTNCYRKNWGASGFTWWSCDMKRNFRDGYSNFYNVCVDTGDRFKKGFTVKDLITFLRVVRNNHCKEFYLAELKAL